MSDPTKFRCFELRDAAMTGSAKEFTAIVELAVPMPRLLRRSPKSGSLTRSRLTFAADDDTGAERTLVSGFRAEFKDLTGSAPGAYIAASKRFVVSATGGQLATLSGKPSVAAIWSNTLRR